MAKHDLLRINIALLFIIGLVSFFLRIYKIDSIPPSLNWDEASIGYNAYSILTTGKDEWGEFLPLHFRSYGEYKLPAQVYASIPGILIFGLNEIGLRIIPVIYGTLSVFLLYFLAKKISGKASVGLLSAFLLAVSPWHIQLTRASFESSFSVFWVLLGLLFFVKGFERPKFWFISMTAFAVAVYTYNSARVFVPLFIAVTLFFYRKDILRFKKHAVASLVLFSVLMLPLVSFVISGEASARYKLVSITDEAGLVPRINERRGNSTLPRPFPRLIHNKVTYISFYFTKNYLAHFTPDFLFVSGAGHRQHHVQGVGQLYLVQAPFLLLGLYVLYKSKNKFTGLIFAWIFITFIPVAVTQDSIPNALRTLIVAPAYQILTGIGLVYVASKLTVNRAKYAFWVLIAGLFFISFYKFANQLYSFYPNLYSRDWQYGNKEVVKFIKENYDNYDMIVYTRHYGEPHMFTLFYFPWDPKNFQSDPNLVRFETFDWVRVTNFDKFYFPDLGDAGTGYLDIIQEYPDNKILFVGKPGDFPEGKETLKDLYFLNGQKAFEIAEYEI